MKRALPWLLAALVWLAATLLFPGGTWGANPITSVTPTPSTIRVIVVNSASIGQAGGGSGLTEPVSVDDNGGSLTVDGTVGISGTVPVSGTFWQATQPVSGTVTATGPLTDTQLRASDVKITLDGESVPVTGTFWQATQPVSGTVTVTDGAGAVNVIVDSGAINATVSDGAGALNTIVDSGTITAVTTITNPVSVTDGAGALNVIVDSGAVTASISQTGTANDVDVATLPSVTVGTFPDNEPINVAQINGVAPTMGNGASGTGVQRVTLASDSTGVIATVGAVTTITNAVTVTQPTASNLNAEIQGDAAHAAPVSGNPILDGAYAEGDGAALDSTNVVEGDITRLKSDIEGRLLVSTAHVNRFNCTMSSTATASTSITGCAAPGAGLSRYITDIFISNSAATAANPATIQTGTGSNCATGTAVLFRCLSMASDTCGGSFQTPIKEAANVDSCFLSVTAGTKTIQIMGFIAP